MEMCAESKKRATGYKWTRRVIQRLSLFWGSNTDFEGQKKYRFFGPLLWETKSRWLEERHDRKKAKEREYSSSFFHEEFRWVLQSFRHYSKSESYRLSIEYWLMLFE